jgi:hypothetical protein
MRQFYSVLAVATVSLVMSTQAQAVLITTSDINQTTSTVAGVTNISFDGNNCAGYASCTGNFLIVNGSQRGQYATPYTDTTSYLTVGPYATGTGNSATLSLGGAANYFGLYWGSIDTYNIISFFLGAAKVASFSGAQLPSLSADGGRSLWASNRYINFDFGSSAFDQVVLTSATRAFETDNHAFRRISVTEPMTLVMMGIGLLGLLATRRHTRDLHL